MRLLFIPMVFWGFTLSVCAYSADSSLDSLDSSDSPQAEHHQKDAQPAANSKGVRKSPLKVSETAPEFTLSNEKGDDVTLSQLLKTKKKLVLFFYPKDSIPGAVAEVEAFQKDREAFEKAGAMVVGVSVDDEPSHRAFIKKNKLEFQLLSDIGGKVAQEYGVMGWSMARQVTYVIGRDGRVKHVVADTSAEKHSKEALKAL